jgi:alpha-glucosidase
VFDFTLMHLPWSAEAFSSALTEAERAFAGPDLWPCWVLSNHDQPRHRSRYEDSEERARAAALLLLTLRGTPCLFEGEELGLLDADVPPTARVDPGGRDGSRAPIPWDATPMHGWPAPPWLPWPPEPERSNAESEAADMSSILALYRRLLVIRRGSPALRNGSWRLLDSPSGTLVYERAWADDVRRIAVNFTEGRVERAATANGWRVELTSRGEHASTRAWDGTVEPSEAVILSPSDQPRIA